MEIKCSIPLYIQLSNNPTAKKYHINLNNYRNWHHQVSNKIKKAYKDIVNTKLSRHRNRKLAKIEMRFVMHRGDKRRIDRSNVLSIHEKFFCDAIVDLGIIKDDNDKYLLKTTYETGELDKINPRIEITIKSVS